MRVSLTIFHARSIPGFSGLLVVFEKTGIDLRDHINERFKRLGH